MLVLPNATMELSNVKKKNNNKNRVPPNVTKVQLGVMLVLPNVMMEMSNVRKKFRI